jgi:acyl-CoA synthetase (AMP-forming)/AMP-acid ligase II
VGYYKDEAKSAATFIMFEGKRYSVPGDYARSRRRLAQPARARLGLHQHRRREGVTRRGRGGAEDPRRSSSTRSAVGIPDEKFGEAITAVVELAPARRSTRAPSCAT